MKPKIIRTESDYEAALARVSVLMEHDPEPTSAKGEELELLCLLVGHYEEEHYPMDPPSPIEAIKFRMEQQGLKAKDLIPYIGSASKVSEVLAGKRSLSMSMVRNLMNGLGIPAEVLVQETQPILRRSTGSKRTTRRKPASLRRNAQASVSKSKPSGARRSMARA